MPQPYRGRPRSMSRVVFPDGQTAVLIPRDSTQFSSLLNGYPLAEEFLTRLAHDDVDAVAIDDGERLYVFDLHRYRTGHRIGHEPYPMKRVVSLEEAIRVLDGESRAIERGAAEWEWLTEADRHPPRDRSAWQSRSARGHNESTVSD